MQKTRIECDSMHLKTYNVSNPIKTIYFVDQIRHMKFTQKIKQQIDKRRNPIPIDQLELQSCKNCEYEFKGHFCPNCGQEVAEFNRPFGFVLYDVFGNFFAFDTRLFRTFKFLLFRPGFITTEFFLGRRMRYTPPVRILVFFSFVLFLLLQTLSDRALQSTLDAGLPFNDNLSDSITLNLNNMNIVGDHSNKSKENTDSETFDIDFNQDLRANLMILAQKLEAEIPQAETEKEKRQLQNYSLMCRMPEILLSKTLDLLSWMFFALVPVFAIILELHFWPPKHRYIKHLIFSTHFHSFQFVVLILIAALALIFSSGIYWMILLLLLTIPIYLLIALKRFYNQSWGLTIKKILGISILYHIMLFTALIVVIVQTLRV